MTIVSPGGGVTVTGQILVTASATDDTGVSGVQFRIDGADLGAPDTSPPYETAWDTALFPDGSHALSAIAWDASGNFGSSSDITVTVDSMASADAIPPVVHITSPLGGSTVSGTVNVTATATDNVGVAGIQYKLDGANLGPRLTLPPYAFSWDTTQFPDGAHDLTAIAVDASLNTASAPTVQVTAQNAQPTPLLSFSTMLGDNDNDSIRDVFVDEDGFVYIAGGSASASFPTTPGAYDRTYNGVQDAYVTKFDPDGNLVFSTFVGGPGYDRAYAIEVDAAGNCYIAGRCGDGFPTTPGVLQPTFGGSVTPNPAYGAQDGFITKVSADGSQLLWSTYFGEDANAVVRDIALGHAGNIFLATTAITRPHPHITPGAFDTTLSGSSDGLVAKISADATQVLYCTYLGGSGVDGGTPSIRVDDAGYAYVLDHTWSTDLPVTPGAYQQVHANSASGDMFVAKIGLNGQSLAYCTYFGGSDSEFSETHGLSIDAAGHAFITATTKSHDLPFIPASIPTPFQATYQGTGGNGTGANSNYSGDVFVAKLSPDGGDLLAFTYVGGQYGEGLEGSAVDADGYVYLGGATFSPNFPVTADALQPAKGLGADCFVVKLSPDLTSQVFGTFWGGEDDDYGRTLAIGPSGEIALGGSTYSPHFPTSPGAYDTTFSGGPFDACLMRIAFQ